MRVHEADRGRTKSVVYATAERALTRRDERCRVIRSRHSAVDVVALARVVDLQVRRSDAQRSIGVRRAYAVSAVVREPARLVRKAVQAAELEAGVIDARKFHRVADAEGIVQIVVIERVGGKVVAQTLACF